MKLLKALGILLVLLGMVVLKAECKTIVKRDYILKKFHYNPYKLIKQSKYGVWFSFIMWQHFFKTKPYFDCIEHMGEEKKANKYNDLDIESPIQRLMRIWSGKWDIINILEKKKTIYFLNVIYSFNWINSYFKNKWNLQKKYFQIEKYPTSRSRWKFLNNFLQTMSDWFKLWL